MRRLREFRALAHDRECLFSRGLWQSRVVLWFAASVVGCVAVAFSRVADRSQTAFSDIASCPQSWVLPPAEFALITRMTRRWLPRAESSGIPQTINALRAEAIHFYGGMLRLRVIGGRMCLTVLSLLCGACFGLV